MGLSNGHCNGGNPRQGAGRGALRGGGVDLGSLEPCLPVASRYKVSSDDSSAVPQSQPGAAAV